MKTKNKFKHLFEKDFEPKEKALTAALIGLAISFNFIFFGMMHIFISNNEDFMIPFASVLRAALIISLPAWAGITLLLFMLPGRIYTIAASFASGLILAGYLQGNVLNSLTPLGELTGDAIYWRMFAKETLVNTAVWLVLLLLPVALRILTNAKTWKTAVLILCILLTGMQASALFVSYISAGDEIHYRPEYFLSRDGIYEVSSQKNIIIFVVDRLDYSYVEDIRKDDPGFFDVLDGFTDFTDAASVYDGTFPSIVHMTTGISYDHKMKRAEYFEYAWNNSLFIDMLKEAGYTTKYHISENYTFTNYEQIIYAADNIKDGRPAVTTGSVILNFTTLAAYRFSPMAFKPSFWLSSINFERTGDISENDYVSNNDPLFMALLSENGLTLQNKQNNYTFVFLEGAHAPYTMDEYGMYAGESDLISQTKGCFRIIYRYIDEMKRLDVYDNSTIIILGDHGWGTFHIGFFVKLSGAAGTPLVQNDAPVSVGDNFLSTILKSEGMEYTDFGVPVFNVDRDTPRERFIADVLNTGDTVAYYKVTGKINDVNRWELIETREFLVDFNIGLPVD